MESPEQLVARVVPVAQRDLPTGSLSLLAKEIEQMADREMPGKSTTQSLRPTTSEEARGIPATRPRAKTQSHPAHPAAQT